MENPTPLADSANTSTPQAGPETIVFKPKHVVSAHARPGKEVIIKQSRPNSTHTNQPGEVRKVASNTNRPFSPSMGKKKRSRPR